MEQVAADAQVADQSLEGPQPFERITLAGRPVAVGDNPSLETALMRQAHAGEHHGVKKEWLTAFEVNRSYRPQFIRLVQDAADIIESHRTALPGTAPHKAMITFCGAQICQQQMQS